MATSLITGFDELRGEVRQLQAMADVLFTLISVGEDDLDGLLDGTLSSYLAGMVDRCQKLDENIATLESAVTTFTAPSLSATS